MCICVCKHRFKAHIRRYNIRNHNRMQDLNIETVQEKIMVLGNETPCSLVIAATIHSSYTNDQKLQKIMAIQGEQSVLQSGPLIKIYL